jgi:anhydro-N-acetylmuramic acid kinase
MKMNPLHIIGLMSGTSLDGVDLVHVRIAKESNFQYTILAAETIPYSSTWKNRLLSGFNLSGKELDQLDADYGQLLAECVHDFILRHNIQDLDLIASHGHTIFHQPEKRYTLQIGNGPQICEHNQIRTICDFRVQDVALGGQGAPLVPIGDAYLFAAYDSCLNLGGFANISFDSSGIRVAYDIVPCNIVLNHYVKDLGYEFDKNGALARSGSLHKELLVALNILDFYTLDPPKSLGFEFVTSEIFPRVDILNLDTRDILRTCLEHTAIQIAGCLTENKMNNCLVTGGGAYNGFLMERIQELTHCELVLPDRTTIDYKEALVFALLGYLKQYNRNNCLKEVTGASQDHSSGVIYDPKS